MSPEDTRRPAKKEVPIPHPPESWIAGNLGDIDPAFTIKSFWRLADIYGPIYSLNLVNRQTIVLSNYELINEVCDDERFEKQVTGPLIVFRDLIKDGECVPVIVTASRHSAVGRVCADRQVD